MSTPVIKKKDLQKVAQAIQEFQSRILHDVDAAKLRDSLNLALLQMQTYWKILKKKQDCKADKYSWPWFDLRNPESNTPHYLASSLYGAGVQKHDLHPLFSLLAVGDLDGIETYVQTNGYSGETDALGRGPLHYCAGVNRLRKHVAFFVEQGCSVDHQSLDGSTALHRAVFNNNISTVTDLINHNASTDMRDCEGRSPVHWAVYSDEGEGDCLKILIESGANLSVPDNENETPIEWCTRNGKVLALRLMLASKDGPRLARTVNGKAQTLLLLGVNHIDVVELLLNTETITDRDKYERNLLHHAAVNGALDVCKLIHGRFTLSTLMTRDCDGRTPVHHAVSNAHSGVTNFLLENGGKTNSKDIQGLTPQSIAELKQLHYTTIVISAYHQAEEEPPPARADAVLKHSLGAPTDSRRAPAVIRNGPSLSKSLPCGPKIQPPSNLSSITPGLLRHSSHQLPQSPQRPPRLRELGDIRERITGCPDRPPSSRGKRSKRPSSPIPGELTDQNLPWKLKNIPQPPSPRHEQAVIVNGNGTEAAEVPTRPRTARGQNADSLEHHNDSPVNGGQVEHHPPQSPRNSRFSRPSDHRPPTTRSIVPDVTSSRDVITASRDLMPTSRDLMPTSRDLMPTSRDVMPTSRDLMPTSRDSSVITSPRSDGTIDQTLEIVQALPDKTGSKAMVRSQTLLGPMPMLRINPDPGPWQRKKLNPVPPNKMDILKPENPPPN